MEGTLLDTFLQASPNLHHLALVIPELPNASTFTKLAHAYPDLSELTLCAYLNGRTWKWPDEAKDYATAISRFPNLRKLAINHDDLAISINALGEAESFGKFAVSCSEVGAKLRQDFCREIARCSVSLEEIAICPFDQQKSRISIERPEGRSTEVSFVDSGSQFFWQQIY